MKKLSLKVVVRWGVSTKRGESKPVKYGIAIEPFGLNKSARRQKKAAR